MKQLDKVNAERVKKAELEAARREYQERVIAQMKVAAKREAAEQDRRQGQDG